MSFFSDFFSGKKTTDSTSNQTAQSSTGLTPEVLNYWDSISNRFTQPWSSIGPNPYQSNAADATAGYASGLNPTFNAAMTIGQGGISTSDINRFQSPYTQQVIDTTVANLRRQNALTGAQQEASAAQAGALGGTGGINRRALRDEANDRTMASTIAGLNDQAFKTALTGAQASTNAQLSGLGAAGSIAGLQSNINNTGFGQGTQLFGQNWQNALMPYQIGQMGASTLAALSPSSGQQSSGTATGTQTVIGTPSPFSALSNLAGLGMQAYSMMPSDERLKENIKPVGETYDGQQIYKYNFKGSPKTEIGLLAQEVEGRRPEAVGEISGLKLVDYDRATRGAERGDRGMAAGGSVGGAGPSDPMDKFAQAYDRISGLLRRSRGGGIGARAGLKPAYADGGGIGAWDTTVTPAAPAQGFDWGRMGRDTSKMASDNTGIPQDDGNLLGQQQQALSQTMAGLMRPAGRADGGEVWDERGPRLADDGAASGLGAPMRLGLAAPDPVVRRELPPPPDLATITAPNGASFEVAAPYADRFRGLVSDLAAAGYGIRGDQSGGYSRRYVAGTDTPSAHAHGTAIDVNWDRNGRGTPGDLPPELARSLAIKHGLTWGGDWRNPDPMHFEVKHGAAPQSGPAAADLDAPEGGRLAATSTPGVVAGMAPVAGPAVAGATYRAPEAAPAPDNRGWWQKLNDLASNGMMAGKAPNAWDRMSMMLMSVGDPLNPGGLTGGAAKAALEMNAQRVHENEAMRRLALAEARSPEEIAHLRAQTKLAELNSDKAYLAEVEARKLEQAKQIARADLEERMKLIDKLAPPRPGSAGAAPEQTPVPPQTRFRWVQDAPKAAAPAAEPATPQAAPTPPSPSPGYAPPDESPAGRAAIRRTELGERIRALDQQRKASIQQAQRAFEADLGKLAAMDFVQKYGNRRQDLTVAQIQKLDAMIDSLSRGRP